VEESLSEPDLFVATSLLLRALPREIYGYNADEARGQITHDLLATTFPVSREAVDAALRDRGRWDGELSHVRKDGERSDTAIRQAWNRCRRATTSRSRS
jgi:PAS domain-containing protein